MREKSYLVPYQKMKQRRDGNCIKVTQYEQEIWVSMLLIRNLEIKMYKERWRKNRVPPV
jgi:hypothetical protein